MTDAQQPSSDTITVQPCCERTGTYYPDGRKRCTYHATPHNLALTAELARRANRIVGSHGWPYGAANDARVQQRMVDWAEGRKLKLSGSHCHELHWLRAGHCSPPCSGITERLGGWADHVTRWTRNGKPAVLLAQPYSLDDDDLVVLGGLTSADDITIIVHATGWYGYGTTTVEVWNTKIWTEGIQS